jgi:enolase-phosphatase E1
MTSIDPNQLDPISHVLLDIEGTTCPVSFVSDTLFPYAAEHLESFLLNHNADDNVKALLQQVQDCWQQDPDPEARSLLTSNSHRPKVLAYLHWLIRKDRKLTALKDLQGLIWEQGYQSGVLQGPLFADVAPALRRWSQAGLLLAVYSSGSVRAQQLIYGNSNAGDLRHLFSHWFDTSIGSKLESSSYKKIAISLKVEAHHILFISDAIDELEAATGAGIQALHCERSLSSPDPRPTTAPMPAAWVGSIGSFDALSNLKTITSCS